MAGYFPKLSQQCIAGAALDPPRLGVGLELACSWLAVGCFQGAGPAQGGLVCCWHFLLLRKLHFLRHQALFWLIMMTCS